MTLLLFFACSPIPVDTASDLPKVAFPCADQLGEDAQAERLMVYDSGSVSGEFFVVSSHAELEQAWPGSDLNLPTLDYTTVQAVVYGAVDSYTGWFQRRLTHFAWGANDVGQLFAVALVKQTDYCDSSGRPDDTKPSAELWSSPIAPVTVCYELDYCGR